MQQGRAGALYTPEERRRRDQSPWTLVQGILAPLQFLVFLVSLALALGLAEMSTTRGVRIESLFIDEGFGALDPVSLGQALALLDQLQASGRRVGVISHVEELKERIAARIEITPTGRGTSRLAVVEG